MPRKPLVGLNADYRPSRKEGPALSFIAAGYYNAIQAAGGIPVIVPPLADADDLGAVNPGAIAVPVDVAEDALGQELVELDPRQGAEMRVGQMRKDEHGRDGDRFPQLSRFRL